MKNKLILYALNLFLLFSICAYAQDITPGYYRVRNVGLATYGGTILKKTGVKEDCYAYVANGTYHVQTTAGYGQDIPSMLLWAGLDEAVVSPQTVIYIAKTGDNYNLEAQGTSVSQMTNYKIIVNTVSGTTDTYTLSTTISGVSASLWALVKKSGIYDKDGGMAYPSNYIATTSPQSGEAYRQWQIVPISASSDNYVAVKACLKVKDEEDPTKFKYYAPYYASYPFKLVSPGMKAYYVSSITDKKYTLQEITNEVIPAATPVIIECPSDKPIDCKIEPLRGNYGSISGNKLKGVYFCNLEMSPETNQYPDCRTEFKKESMRVWAVKDDKLILTNSTDRTIYNTMYSGFSGYWLRPNESYLADVPSTTAAELVSAGKATTISFDSDGGTAVEDISGGEGDPVTAPANPTKTGYSFTGWNPALPSVFPAEDMTVKAQWQINQYTITFNTNGGTTIFPITQNYNTAINKPSDPTKEGYTFAGWDATIPDLMPAENITINALWTTNQYTITFDTDGGTTISPISQDYGTSVTAPANPTKTGYTFVGWDKAVPSTMPAGNVVIKAQWQINQYTITFDTDGGSEVSPITQDYNTVITKPSDPTKTGSSFAGWDKEIPSIMPAENLTIKALWTVGKYTITFDTDGGTAIAPISQDYGTSVTAPANPTKTGYTFVGWDKEIPSTMPAGNVVIKAQWQINQYTITFDTDGGSEVSPITQDYNTAITKPSDPTKTGSSFVGWDKEIPSIMPAENLTIKALWTIGKYTITFDTDGGTAIAPISQDYGTSVVAPADPTKTGYTFTGWDKAVPSTMPSENMTIKAQWQINQYTITFDTDGGSEVSPITQDYNTAITKPSDPTKTGSSFAGWDKAIPSTMPAENITIKALWKKLYTITFNTDGGTEVASITKAVGEPVTAPANPTKTGYTFASWNPAFPETMPENNLELKAVWNKNQHKVTFYNHDDIIFKEIFVGYDEYIVKPTENPEWPGHTFLGWNLQPETKMPDEDVSYRAIWDEAEFTITFDTDGGSVIAPITQKYGSEITAPANPTKTGYTFTGWNEEIPSTMPAKNMTIKALWQINEYNLNYFIDGTLYKSVKYAYNTAVTAEPAAEKVGYTFSGWQGEIPSVMPANDVTITGSFSINQYTITFDADGGTEVTPITQNYNTAITKPSDPTRTGYTFTGWDKEIPSTMPAENMTIKALWQINQYTITFDTDGGSEVSSITQDYNTEIAMPISNNPTKEGYTFMGWNPELPEKMPLNGLSVKAQWQINEYSLNYFVDGTLYKSVKYVYNTAVTAEPAAEKVGYTFSGWQEEIPSVMPANDVTITGTFSVNQYTITFDTDGGTEVAAITQNYNTSIVPPSNPMKEGYTFIGWDKEIPSTMPAENMTIKALWQINEYSLNYFVDGTLYKSVKYVYNTAVTAEPAAEKIGYTFSGWQEEIPSVMPAKDVTITGSFSVNPYTITFDTDGGTTIAPITQNYNTSIAKPSNPTKEGYTFIGWDKEIPSTMPAENMTIKALWQINEYSLNYFVDGTLYKSVKYVYNTAVTAEPAAEKIGYTFSGWQEEIPTVMPAKDVTITGTFKINQYTITFDSNGGTEVVSITQDYGTKIKVDAPTKDGYDFAGWDPALPETMPAKNMDLKAIWGPKEVEKEYSLNEGWTWISFYLINPDMSSFDNVLSSLKWNSTDEIKGTDTWAIYSAKKHKWVGTMEGFNDLSMYKIHSSYSGQELKLNGGYINSKADQKVSVEKGWNYLPYLSLGVLPVDEALQNYAASEGDILKSQTQSATFINGEWRSTGGLTSMEPGKGYMLHRSADNKVSFTYPIALEEEKSNSSRAMRFEGKAQRFSSNMNVFATVEGVMAVPGDSIVAVAIDGVRGGATIDNEGKASLTILGDNNADIYLALMHNNTVVASAKAPINYASDNIVGSYANPTAIEFVEGSEAWSGDYNVTAIFTMDGKQLPTTDIKTLTTGLYIIKYETLSDNNSNTGGCRVIRVVR